MTPHSAGGRSSWRRGSTDYADIFVKPMIAIVKETPSIADNPLIADEGKRYTDEIQGMFVRFLAAEDTLAADAARDADKRSSLAVIVGAIGIGASAALIILFGVFLARSIGRPVRAVASGATRLAAGEWSLRSRSRPRRNRRAHTGLQRDGGADRAEPRGARGTERGAP